MTTAASQEAAGLLERRFADVPSAAAAMAASVARQLLDGLLQRGRASLLVSGGKSPVPLFHALREQPLDWRRIGIGLVDERWVDPASVDSNERLVREHLLGGRAAEASFVPLKTAAACPEDAVAERTAALDALAHPFTAVVLGMGEDGHTASLFPGTEGLAAALSPDGPALLAAARPPHAPHPRLTLTVRGLLESRVFYLMIQGPAKFAAYRAACEGAELPIGAILRQTHIPVEVYLIDS
jgi:6-phosphogluconolactonase